MLLYMDEFKELEKEFNNAKDNYQDFLSKTEPLVNSKIISKGFLFNLRAYDGESAGFKMGKKLKDLPKSLKDIFIYYFDAGGKIIMVDKYGATPNIIDKEFLSYEGNQVKSVYYSGGFIRLRNVLLAIQENDRTSKVYNYGMSGISFKEYIYGKDGLLEKIIVQQKTHKPEDAFQPHELQFHFDEKNELKDIKQVFPNGFTRDVYP
jgi:hypothetical protein